MNLNLVGFNVTGARNPSYHFLEKEIMENFVRLKELSEPLGNGAVLYAVLHI